MLILPALVGMEYEPAQPEVSILRNSAVVYKGTITKNERINTGLYFNEGDYIEFDYSSSSGVYTNGNFRAGTRYLLRKSAYPNSTHSNTITTATGTTVTYDFSIVRDLPSITIGGKRYEGGAVIRLATDETVSMNVDDVIDSGNCVGEINDGEVLRELAGCQKGRLSRLRQIRRGNQKNRQGIVHFLLTSAEKERLEEVDDKAVYSKDLKSMLLELYRKAPKGIYGYRSRKADPIRPLVDSITTYMLTGDESSLLLFMELLGKLKKRDGEVKRICQRDKIDPSPHLLAEKFKEDLYRRCGNEILGYIRKADTMESKISNGDAARKRRWDEKRRRGYLFSKAMKLDGLVSQERISVFDEYRRALQNAEYQRLKEEGVIEA